MAENKCSFYPIDEEIVEYGPICGAGSDVSGGLPCTQEDEKTCQWAQQAKKESSL